MMRFLRWVAILGIVGYLTYLASIAPHVGYWLVTIFAYVAAAYVLWRALPAIRSDLEQLRGRKVRLFSPGRYSRGGDL